MSNILEVRNLRKRYEEFSLNDVSFHIPQGYVMGFIGPNGAGKTTTIKAILDMIHTENGGIEVFGLTYAEDALKIKEALGVVMDLPFYSEDWTPGDVEAALSPFYSRWDHERYRSLLERFGLSARKKIKEFSRGMKGKLMLAAALSHHARLLILDEPTSGLDPVARDDLLDLLREYVTEETGVLFSTHITSDLEKVADYITYIMDGTILFTGGKDDLLERYLIVRGDRDALSEAQRGRIIGYRAHSVGFEGLIEAADFSLLPPGTAAERAGLDDIIVYMSKGGVSHDRERQH